MQCCGIQQLGSEKGLNIDVLEGLIGNAFHQSVTQTVMATGTRAATGINQ